MNLKVSKQSNEAVLLINLGTPDKPELKDVRRYLSVFLNDPRVIDIPWLFRILLVNLIIIPFRTRNSTSLYKKLWTKDGSPLLIHSLNLQSKVANQIKSKADVFLAMRYGNPSIFEVLQNLKDNHYRKITILPLYPHYASSSTGSTIQLVLEQISKWYVIPELNIISQFYQHPLYIEAVSEQGLLCKPNEFDHILFSYHGLPVRQVDKVYDNGPCSDHNCENDLNGENEFCYKATVYETSRLIAARLNIPKEKYTVAFQSRLNKKWLEPFSDEVVKDLAQKGIKKLLVFSPAFVADCLETIIEIGDEYNEIFIENGGEKLTLVPGLNSSDSWVKAVCSILNYPV